jgi:peptide/nickel transport system substrate-binding protein
LAGCADQGSAAAGNNGEPGQIPETIRIANEATTNSVDPTLCGATEGFRLCYLTNGYLVEFGTGEPELAESLVAEEDNMVWTATLRPDLKFSDGSALTSEDVVASIERYLAPPLEGTLEVLRNIESVGAVDERTVTINLKEPDAFFVSSISYERCAILPSDKLDDETLGNKPIGAGEYVLEEFDLAAGNFTLQANPNWWGDQPKVKTIEITTVPDGATRLAQVRTGQVDYAKSVPANLVTDLPESLRVEKVGFPGGMIHLVFNANPDYGSVTSDVRVRQAINIAVDRAQIASVALKDFMDPLYGVPWIDPSDRAAPIERDLDRARELLRGTACENGCPLRLINITDFNWQLPVTSTIVQQNLAEIGIDVELVNTAQAATGQIANDQWDGAVVDPGYAVMTDASIAQGIVSAVWWGDGARYTELVDLQEELATATEEESAGIKERINESFAEIVPWVGLTDLYFLDVTSLPADVISSPIGWKLIVA